MARFLCPVVLAGLLFGNADSFRFKDASGWDTARDAKYEGGWKPTWAMNESTIILWRNATGLQPAEDFKGYGVVMLDWSHAAAHWINDFHPMNNGAALAEQCAAVKAANPNVKCVVYRNSVKALNQFADVGEKVDDPRYAGFFLPFREDATSPTRCWCGGDTVGANLLWLVHDYFGGKDCLGADSIDGLILDDNWSADTGPSEENEYSLGDMGLTPADAADIASNWSLALDELQSSAASQGKYIVPSYAGDSMSTRSHNHTECAQRMRQLGCAPDAGETGPMVFTVRFNSNDTAARQLTAIDATLDVAYYLLGRGPVAWIGAGYCLGWALALRYDVPAERPITIADFHVDLFERDYGVPLGRCEETSQGSEVFVRQWSKATAKIDCRAFTGHITMNDN
eukprot:g4966.t1